MRWNQNFDYHDLETKTLVYIADAQRSVIKFYNSSGSNNNLITHVSGIAYNNGYRDGPLRVALFNNPFSLLNLRFDNSTSPK